MTSNYTNSIARQELQETFSSFQQQLQAILETDFYRDESLVKGCLQLIHSKISQMLQQCLLEDFTGDSDEVGVHSSAEASAIVDFTWKYVHYPFFKVFQTWKGRPAAEGSRPSYGNHRQLNATLQKYFPHIHKFYYSIVEMIFSNYNLSLLIPSDVRSKLNISAKKMTPEEDALKKLEPEDQFSVDCIIAFQRCLLYIACCHRYKIIMEHLSDRYLPADFQKSLRYLDIATTVVPSVGETYLQRGICYTHTKNFGNAAYQFVRSSLSRIPSDAGIPNIKNLLGDPNGSLFKKLLNSLDDLKVQETIKKRIINMEIMEFYILPLIGSYIFPETWRNNRHSERLKHFHTLLFDKIEIRYIKNISMIFQDLILVIGAFHINQMISSENVINVEKKVEQTEVSADVKFLEFIFKFFTHLLDKIIMKEFKNPDMFQYLAMVRIMTCWIKSNKTVLRFAHRHSSFCQSMVNLTNELLGNEDLALDFSNLHRPTRGYFFEEDIVLKEFNPIKYTLSDFNDEQLFAMDNLPDRLSGKYKKRMDIKEEHKLRIQAIFYSNKKFLEKNGCGFKFDTTKKRYIQSTNSKRTKGSVPSNVRNENGLNVDKETRAGRVYQQRSGVSINTAFSNRESSNDSSNSVIDRPHSSQFKEDLKDNAASNTLWNYSGSSVPSAPQNFNVTPSFSVPASMKRSDNDSLFSLYNKADASNATNSNSNGSAASSFPSLNNQAAPSIATAPIIPQNISIDLRQNSNGIEALPKLNVQNLSTFNSYMQDSSHDSQISIFARDNLVFSSQLNTSSGLYEQAQQRTYMGSQYAQFHHPLSSMPNEFENLQNHPRQSQNPPNVRRDSQFFPTNSGSLQTEHLPSMPQQVNDQFNFFFY